MVILQVAVATPLDSLFDYLAPAAGPPPQPGQRVRVPFGRREQTGVIVRLADHSTVPASRLRAAAEIIDAEPLFDSATLALLEWATGYYQHPPGEVFAAALPSALRKGAAAEIPRQYRWIATVAGKATDTEALAKKASVQAKLLGAIVQSEGLREAELRGLHPGWRKIIANLSAKELVASILDDNAVTPPGRTDQPPRLTADQRIAIDAVPARGFNACLLEGVTGSGKTEVYLQLIAAQLQQGKQSLVLVPEIGLTPQLVERFERHIDGKVGVMHSGLNDSQRLAAWVDARNGDSDVIIGTRSAIYAQLPRLGLIVVDEEHDASYKQQDGFRYSARDIAVYRARQLDIPVVLGSATPAFETLHNALEQRYLHMRLPERPGNAQQPTTHLIDLRTHALRDGLSQPFINAMRTHLEAGGQTLVYLNRRGFAPTLLCPSCGETQDCRRCDARMVLHQRQHKLVCHHCGSERAAIDKCPECQEELVPVGQGTERLEQSLAALFPDYPLVRIDRDTTRRVGELDRLLQSIRDKESRILLGTQMLTKGHDFADVSFVGIIDPDQGFFGTDFRSSERLAQTILQVAGRAGRAERPGEVWIQTFYPDHPLLQTLLIEGYGSFAEQALTERQAASWPPFCYLALLRAECVQRELLFEFLDAALATATPLAAPQLRILGPASSPMERRSGRYRGQLLIQASHRGQLQQFLAAWKSQLADIRAARKVRWSIDVDPVELF
ncbi:MAG: primosomal protein N' [Pseudomonadales bacterium]